MKHRATAILASFLGAAAMAAAACGSSGGSSAGAPAGGSGADAGALDGAKSILEDGETAAPEDGSTRGADVLAPVVDAGAYADGSLWVCGANASHDYCLDTQAITDVHPDLTQTAGAIAPATDPPIDCFYVYPSVDVTSPAGNETSFANLADILDPIHEQAAPFTQVCKVYAPLYHQATYDSYFAANADQYLEVAYADVAAAFEEYLATYNHGRDFVLLGHSQGTHMLRRLIQRQIEPNPGLQKQFLLAILAGSLGDVTVPKGQLVGGSFQSTPLCSSGTQRGCVISYSSFAEGYAPTASYGSGFPIGAGMDIACANPAALGGTGTFADALFFTKFANPDIDPPQTSGVTTAFASYATLFSGACVASANGYSFLQIAAAPGAGDTRSNPIPFANEYYSPAIIGLHLLDYSFPMGDLLAAVQSRANALDGGPSDAAAE